MPDTALRFICDSMLGRLAKSLRMLGFDTLYARLPHPAAAFAIVRGAAAHHPYPPKRFFPNSTPTVVSAVTIRKQ